MKRWSPYILRCIPYLRGFLSVLEGPVQTGWMSWALRRLYCILYNVLCVCLALYIYTHYVESLDYIALYLWKAEWSEVIDAYAANAEDDVANNGNEMNGMLIQWWSSWLLTPAPISRLCVRTRHRSPKTSVISASRPLNSNHAKSRSSEFNSAASYNRVGFPAFQVTGTFAKPRSSPS